MTDRTDPMRPQLPTPRSLLLGLNLGLVAVVPGCNAVTPFGTLKTYESGTPSFIAGRASQSYPSSPALVDAARGAIDDVGIRSVDEIPERGGVLFVGKTADGRAASISVTVQGKTSHVSARVGSFGDETLSRAFFDRLATRLHEDEPEADPVDPAPAVRTRARDRR